MTIDQLREMPDGYLVCKPGTMCLFWDGDAPTKWVLARYSHSERTTPIDRHWTMDKEYFHNVHANPSVEMPLTKTVLRPERSILAPEHSS